MERQITRTVPEDYKPLLSRLLVEAGYKGDPTALMKTGDPLAAAAELLKGKKVLEIGASPGLFVMRLQQAGVDVVGVDIEPWETDKARGIIPCDARDMSKALGDAKFDFIVSNGTMSREGLISNVPMPDKIAFFRLHYPNGMQTLNAHADGMAREINAELARHLKDGGAIIHVADEQIVTDVAGLPLKQVFARQSAEKNVVVLRKE